MVVVENSIFFMHHDSHLNHQVGKWHDFKFFNLWIERGAQIPIGSPDLNPADFFFGTIKTFSLYYSIGGRGRPNKALFLSVIQYEIHPVYFRLSFSRLSDCLSRTETCVFIICVISNIIWKFTYFKIVYSISHSNGNKKIN